MMFRLGFGLSQGYARGDRLGCALGLRRDGTVTALAARLCEEAAPATSDTDTDDSVNSPV
jgi:hypothetical protein